MTVLSLTCLTDEELCEEISLEATDKENASVSKRRKAPRKRKRLGFARKLKSSVKKSPLKVKPNKESLHTVTSETSFSEPKQVDNGVKNIESETDSIKNVESSTSRTVGTVQEETQQEGKQGLPTLHKEKPHIKALPKRGGRGFARRGRGGRGRRNLTKLAREKLGYLDDPPQEASDQIRVTDTHESADSLIKGSPDLTKVPGVLKSGDVEEADKAVPVDTTVGVKASTPDKRVIKRKGKIVQRNAAKSSQDDAEPETTCAKPVRPRRKSVKSEEEGSEGREGTSCSPGRTRRKSSLSSLENSDAILLNPKPNKRTGRESLRKRTTVKLPDASDCGNQSKEEFTIKDPAEETCQKNTQPCEGDSNSVDSRQDKEELVSPIINREAKAVKNSAKIKRFNKTKSINSSEEPSKLQDDDVSIQSQITEIIPAQDFVKSTEDVKTVSKLGKRKGRQPVVSDNVEAVHHHEQHFNISEPPQVDPNLPPPPRRVKTKAQLKQKPSELFDSDNDIEPPVHKKSREADLRNTEQQQCSFFKQTGKKQPSKPKTLARIWRTRKKSGFTHRKKSKPKPGNVNFSTQSDKDFEVEEDKKTVTDSTKEAEQNGQPSDIVNDGNREGDNQVDNNDLKQVSPCQAGGNAYETTVVYESPFLPPDIEENRKLPQKKRHTAKLAAERQKAAADQANATSETVVADTAIPSGSVALDMTLDLTNTCTDFNETNAIESLIQLSNATDEPYSGPSQEGAQHDLSSADYVPTSVNGLSSPHSPPLLQAEVRTEEVNSAVESISQKETETAIDNITEEPLVTPNDVLHELMKIATSPKAEASEKDEQQNRQGKRAYKREFKVQCRFCQVKVKDYGYLFRHVKKLHRDKGKEMQVHLEEIRPLMRTPCPICHKMVSSISNISSHIKQCHATKDSAVLCPICKKTYKTTVSLRQHLRQCHQPQQHRFFCHLCDANFTEKRSLKEHINCSHETTQVFHCDECGKSFLTKGRLRRHKYIHGDFRHKCNYCGKGFHLKDNMNKHIEIVHEKTQGKRFSCPHCDKKFTVKGNMTQHVMGVHLKQFQYTCPQCQTGFRRKKDMLSHMIKHGDSGAAIPTPESGLNEDEEEEEGDTGWNSDKEEKKVDSPWHGRGEKTDVITGLTSDSSGSEGSQAHRKTEVIIISPIPGYSAP